MVILLVEVFLKVGLGNKNCPAEETGSLRRRDCNWWGTRHEEKCID
jgi:hypothetical protein